VPARRLRTPQLLERLVDGRREGRVTEDGGERVKWSPPPRTTPALMVGGSCRSEHRYEPSVLMSAWRIMDSSSRLSTYDGDGPLGRGTCSGGAGVAVLLGTTTLRPRSSSATISGGREANVRRSRRFFADPWGPSAAAANLAVARAHVLPVDVQQERAR
jgi:hypothetical protein